MSERLDHIFVEKKAVQDHIQFLEGQEELTDSELNTLDNARQLLVYIIDEIRDEMVREQETKHPHQPYRKF